MNGKKNIEIAGTQVEWLSEEQVRCGYPQSLLNTDCLRYGSSFSVELSILLDRIADSQAATGHRFQGAIEEARYVEDGWLLKGTGVQAHVETLVYACGSALYEWLPQLRGVLERGHLLSAEGPMHMRIYIYAYILICIYIYDIDVVR